MIRRSALAATAALALAALAIPSSAAALEECSLVPRTACFGIESVDASLSTTQAGAHPDVRLDVGVKQDPASDPNVFALRDSFGATRHLRFNTPPGLIGDPNVLGVPQQCTVQELVNYISEGCPNGSQIGISTIYAYELLATFREPIYMMVPPGGDVVARLGTIAGLYATFIDIRVRSEGDYGLVADVREAPAAAKLIKLESTLWGVPAHPSHDTERCTASEVFQKSCVVSPPRPPGSRPLPFFTNPTRCGVPLEVGVAASNWLEPERLADNEVSTPMATISGCNRLPFGPSLVAEPTSRQAGAPTGLDMTIRLPASDGVDVLEPSQIKDIRIDLPAGLAVNPGSADGLATCSAAQVRFKERVNAQCPDAAKLASGEFDVPALPRRMKGAIYLREPEPGNPFRVWVVADDLGAHVKLPGQLEVNKTTGQIKSVVLDSPQAPLREVKLLFKSGARAPLLNPRTCGIFNTHYRFTPWSGGPDAVGAAPMSINQGCDTGGFAPKLNAGTTDPGAGQFSPFLFTLTRQDGESNPAALDIALPPGLAASFRGVARCQGAAFASGNCPAASRIGHVRAAVGAGSAPLWVPQTDPGKRPTAVYLGGPYRGAPLSIVAVVPRQAGPFDFGDEVVRSAIHVDPRTAQATVKSDPLPQIIEGVPVPYRTIHVSVDRPGFTLNPTGCKGKEIKATVASITGQSASPTSPFHATNCASLGFKPRISLALKGGTKRGDHPAFTTIVRPRPGEANIERTVVKLPRSAFLDQANIRTICTRVQFAKEECPAGSVYGHVKAFTPLLDEPLEGPAILRSSDNFLPDLVFDLDGLVEIESAGRIDSIRGGIRATFEGIPDAPLTKVVVAMQGGEKGLIVNSKDLCAGKTSRAEVKLGAHNGRKRTLRPKMRASCKAKRSKRSSRQR